MREVLHHEVAPFAKTGHGPCGGTGGVVLVKRDKNGNEARAQITCVCAMKRFLKAYPDVRVDTEGRKLYWPDTDVQETAPAPLPATGS